VLFLKTKSAKLDVKSKIMSHFKHEQLLLTILILLNLIVESFSKNRYMYSNSSIVDIITEDETHRIIDTYKKEPRFLSFTTSDDAIEVCNRRNFLQKITSKSRSTTDRH
jgi:hypothetical protein